MRVKAILFDTQSIQKYIFSGNRLKTNIGASYLVDQVFDLALLPVIRSVVGKDELDALTWKQEKNPDWTKMTNKARIGYIGGGNALVLFRDDVEEKVLRKVVTEFTKKLLTDYPGLRTGAAIGELELGKDGAMGVKANLTALVHQLQNHQSTEFPVVNVPYTGLTLSCEVNGEAANAYDRDEKRFFSWEVEAKLRADRRTAHEEAPAEEELLSKLRSVLPAEKREAFLSEYAFPMEIGELGQRETEDYIAIVHIDGNNMGAKFANCKTLTQRKNMSLAIRQQTISAFTELLQVVAHKYDSYHSYLTLRKKEGKAFLPVRPLVLGGDDMTFVCTAKVAFPYANYLIRNLQQKGIFSCGGIAILPSSYPFFRGYEMAEQLCDAAKKSMRTLQARSGEESCWLDFAILHGEQAPTLEQIRAQEYQGVLGDMHFGPYRVDAEAGKRHSLAALLQGVELLQTAKDRLPMNKIKDLRRILARGEHEQKQFMAQLHYLNQSGTAMRLPQVPAWQAYEENLWADGRTPYVDAIELMDYIVPEEVQA